MDNSASFLLGFLWAIIVGCVFCLGWSAGLHSLKWILELNGYSIKVANKKWIVEKIEQKA